MNKKKIFEADYIEDLAEMIEAWIIKETSSERTDSIQIIVEVLKKE